MTQKSHNFSLDDANDANNWLKSDQHRDWLIYNSRQQFETFKSSLKKTEGFHTLDLQGQPLHDDTQEIHTTTRLIHSYSLGKLANFKDSDEIIDQGMAYLWQNHRDQKHGGYVWSLNNDGIKDGRKLAYGHMFVLLAGSTAKLVGHPDADRLLEDVTEILETKYWEPSKGLFADEYTQDWQPFSNYRGMNANMHATEALLSAYEATGEKSYLEKAGSILKFFVDEIAPQYDWQLPEHYNDDWTVNKEYSENPMFRPAGTTPGHSFELARLLLQYWDLKGRPENNTIEKSRRLITDALNKAWDHENGGVFYTLNFDRSPAIKSRYWWPVTEAIGVIASLLKIEHNPEDEVLYRRLWKFADKHFIDHEKGGWFPEIDSDCNPTSKQFVGKPDIYHSIQATLFPLASGISRQATSLPDIS